MKKRNIFNRIWRNSLALIKRFILSLRHGNRNEIAIAGLSVIDGFVWLLSAVLAIICLAAGLVSKPHCLVLSVMFLFLCALANTSLKESKNLR